MQVSIITIHHDLQPETKGSWFVVDVYPPTAFSLSTIEPPHQH